MRLNALALVLLAAALVPAAAGGKDPPPETTITSGPPAIGRATSATIAFTSNQPDARFACALDDEAFSDCNSPASVSVADGAHRFYVVAVKSGDTDPTPAVWSWTVDTTPPAALRQRVDVGYSRLVLRWGALRTQDANHVVVLRATDPKKQPTRTVYSGSASSYVDARFENGVYHRYRLVASDAAGNSSPSVDVVVEANALLLAPKEDARLRAPTILRWRAVRKATFYNAQLWLGSKKVLSAWPRSPRLKITRSWSYLGHRYQLKPGRYTWYVWPSFGPLKLGRYGQLLGAGHFRGI
jgi:hypothetical protein